MDNSSTLSGQKSYLLTLFLYFFIAMLEGFDIQSMGVAAPFAKQELALSTQQLSWVFSAATFGMFPGAIVGGRIADFLGRKNVLIGSVAIFGAMSLLTAYCNDYTSLLGARFLTGLGMGAALPLMISMAAESVSPQWHGRAVSIMYAGVPIGAAVTAIIAGHFTSIEEWRHIFYLGGLTPLILVPILMFFLQETYSKSNQQQTVRYSFQFTLFAENRWYTTLCIWTSFFCTLIVLYFILNWLPVLMQSNGLDTKAVSKIQLFYQIGAAIGTLFLGQLTDKANIKFVVVLIYAGIMAGLGMIAFSHDLTYLIFSAALCGAFLTGGQSVLYALAAMAYPTHIRGTGVGVAVAIGRIGSFVGPLVAGFILAISNHASTVIGASIPVVAVALISALILVKHLPRSKNA